MDVKIIGMDRETYCSGVKGPAFVYRALESALDRALHCSRLRTLLGVIALSPQSFFLNDEKKTLDPTGSMLNTVMLAGEIDADAFTFTVYDQALMLNFIATKGDRVVLVTLTPRGRVFLGTPDYGLESILPA